MSTSKENGSGFVHECFYRCESSKHVSNLIAAVIKSNLSDEKVAAYLKWCCVRYARQQAVDSYGRSLIYAAASTGRLQLLRFLLMYKDVNINSKDFESAYSPLHSSLYYGQIHCAVRLIQEGANLQQTDFDGLTPLNHIMKDRPSILIYNADQPCEVYIWGMNTNYTLGIGHNNSRSSPDLLDYFRKENISIKQAFISKFHSLFLGSNGKVWTCGLGSGGRLGLGDETTYLVPKVLKVGSSSSEICISASIGTNHSVLLMENGCVWSFGLNTYHQLGHSPPPPKLLSPKVIKALKGLEIVGVCASKFHTVFWTKNQLLTCGLHGGQLGHLKTTENTIPIPKVVPKLDLKSLTIQQVAASDGATVVVTSEGDIFLLHEYQCKKIPLNAFTLGAKKVCILGGQLDHKVYTSCLQEKRGDELKMLILTRSGSIYLWEESSPRMTQCFLSLHRVLVITDIVLNRVSLLLTTSDGEAFQGKIKAEKRKTFSGDNKSFLPKSNFTKFINEDECNYIKLKRIPHVYRAVNVACDLKGRNFAIVQTHPKMGLFEVPLVDTSEMKQNMKMLLTSADEFDTLHDVVFEVGGVKFPAHRYVVSHSSHVLETLINEGELVDDVYHVKIDDVQPQIFQRILSYLYTGECDLLKIGACPLSFDSRFPDKKEEILINVDEANHDDIFAFEYYKQQRKKKKNENKTESKAKDPIKSLRDAARIFDLRNLSEILGFLRYDNGYICKTNEKNIQLKKPVFNRKKLQYLWDIILESENGEFIKAHKCILVARLEYFNCMINQGWLESSLKVPLKLQLPGKVLEILIHFLYTDDAPELLSSDDLDLASHVLVISDQFFCSRLKELSEVSLVNMITLENAAEMLQLSVTYNANQLKKCAMEYICLNLSAILELRSLEILDDSLLHDLNNFYRSWLPAIRTRKIGTHIEAPDDKFIESIYNAEPFSFEKAEEEISFTPNLKTPKKKSQREKKKSKSENQGARNISIGSINSDEELFSALDYCSTKVQEETWITVTSHPNKQQKMLQNGVKIAPILKPLDANSPRAPTIPIQKSSSVVPLRVPQKKESFDELDREFFQSTCEKEFPALNASAPERIFTAVSPKSPSENSKKFVKLSQKQRKRIANQSKSEDEDKTKKSVEVVKSVWGIPEPKASSPRDIMKTKSNPHHCAMASSPPWQGLSPSSCSLSAIMAAERQQRDLLAKIKSKPLEYTQMEDKAMDDLMLLYNIPNVTDERITIRRADPIIYTPPVWVTNHR